MGKLNPATFLHRSEIPKAGADLFPDDFPGRHPTPFYTKGSVCEPSTFLVLPLGLLSQFHNKKQQLHIGNDAFMHDASFHIALLDGIETP